MYEDTSEQGNDVNRQMMQRVQQDRQNREMMARRLREEAVKQGLTAMEGIFAVPATLALTAASWAMYAVAFLERGFEAFQRTSDDMDRQRERREGRWDRQDQQQRQDRPEGTQPRA